MARPGKKLTESETKKKRKKGRDTPHDGNILGCIIYAFIILAVTSVLYAHIFLTLNL